MTGMAFPEEAVSPNNFRCVEEKDLKDVIKMDNYDDNDDDDMLSDSPIMVIDMSRVCMSDGEEGHENHESFHDGHHFSGNREENQCLHESIHAQRKKVSFKKSFHDPVLQASDTQKEEHDTYLKLFPEDRIGENIHLPTSGREENGVFDVFSQQGIEVKREVNKWFDAGLQLSNGVAGDVKSEFQGNCSTEDRSVSANSVQSQNHGCKYSNITLVDFLQVFTQNGCPCSSKDPSIEQATNLLMNSVMRAKETQNMDKLPVLNAFFNIIELLNGRKHSVIDRFISDRFDRIETENSKISKRVRKRKFKSDDIDWREELPGTSHESSYSWFHDNLDPDDWAGMHFHVPYKDEVPPDVLSFEWCISGLITELSEVGPEVWAKRVVKPKKVVKKRTSVEDNDPDFKGFTEEEIKAANKKRAMKHFIYLDHLDFHGWDTKPPEPTGN